jgi:hypothetical protein
VLIVVQIALIGVRTAPIVARIVVIVARRVQIVLIDVQIVLIFQYQYWRCADMWVRVCGCLADPGVRVSRSGCKQQVAYYSNMIAVEYVHTSLSF